MPQVSIVVPCRNERSHIEASIRSILAQETPPGGFECLVADGCSDDGTREVLARLAAEDPRLRVVDNPGRIVSTGLNAAIRASAGAIIIRMDAHTEYAPDYVRRCVEVLRETGAQNVGGPWVAVGEGRVSRAIAAAFQSPFAAGGARSHDPDYEGPVDAVYLGCWPREVLEQAGLFDEELVRNQDDELSLRLTRAGARLWQSPRIRSVYRPRNSLRALFRQYTQYGYWKVRVIQKHRVPASPRHLVPGAFVAALVGLPLLGLAWPPMFWVWGGMTGAYLLVVGVATVKTARAQGADLLPLLPAVFAGYHIGYGYGFLRGVVDFMVLRRGARGATARSPERLARHRRHGPGAASASSTSPQRQWPRAMCVS
ncbi:MAG: glycosyltransferase family 2 protein [Gemmatimonadetes bacterium]|nr:glycosyltransferase family 2 protein [Gemmatimonadota bacterium]